MSVTSTVNRAAFSGNGTTTVFSFPYFFTSASDLTVYLTDSSGNITEQTITTDYTVGGTQASNGTYPSGGSITMLTAPASGYTLTIVREVSPTQPASWVDGDADPSAVKELAFDRTILALQRVYDMLGLVPIFPDGSTAGFSPALPFPAVAGALLAVNQSGDGWTYVGGSSGGGAGYGTPTQENPSGTVNGSNTSFSLVNTPISNGSASIFLDGLILRQGTDYTISANTITMTTAPSVGQSLYAVYQH
jgi:hypothetical protein